MYLQITQMSHIGPTKHHTSARLANSHQPRLVNNGGPTRGSARNCFTAISPCPAVLSYSNQFVCLHGQVHGSELSYYNLQRFTSKLDGNEIEYLLAEVVEYKIYIKSGMIPSHLLLVAAAAHKSSCLRS